jgi:hypothetical protein
VFQVHITNFTRGIPVFILVFLTRKSLDSLTKFLNINVYIYIYEGEVFFFFFFV